VESYLSRKWKISVPTLILPQAHPFYSIQPFARYFNPIDVLGCQLWLDGADASTVTGTTSVTAWNDKSGNGYNAILSTGTNVTAPTYLQSTKGIQFTAGNFSNGPTAVGNALAIAQGFGDALVGKTFSIFAVALRGANQIADILAGLNASANNNLFFEITGSSLIVNEYGSVLTGAITPYVSPDIAALYNFTLTSSQVEGFSNGTSVGTSAFTLLSSFTGPEIGRRYGSGPYTTYSSMTVFELIAFIPALTTAQRQAVEGYLAWKWGLNASLPATGHSFSKFPASTAAQFNPVTVTGCLLWLDGADSNATANITTGVWYDKSGLSSTATSNAGGGAFSMGTINTVPAVAFPAASVARLTASTAISTATGFSVFMVASMSALASSRTYLLSEGNTAYRVYASTTAFPAQVGTYVGAFFSSLTSPSLAVSTPFVYSATVGATQFNQWINGVVNTVTGTVTTFTGTTMNIGNYSAASSVYAFTGQMGEVIIYSGVVTTARRQAVEGYLAWKWGLQTNLPTTHPFYKFAPGAVGY
jgi:hypothetical protein